MTLRPRGVKEKDASTRFMRVDQLGSVQTVAMPAAQLLAAAAASAAPEARAAVSHGDGAPTVAMAAAATLSAPTLPAPTVARRRVDRVALAPVPTLGAARMRAGSISRARGWRTIRLHARTLALAILLTSVVAGVAWMELRPAHDADSEASSAAGAPKDAGKLAEDRAAAAPAPPPAPPPAPTTSPAAALAQPSTAEALAQAAPGGTEGPALPARAADQLAAGDYSAALVSYQQLSRTWPEDRAFTLVAQVLERKLRVRCTGDATSGGPECER